MKRRQWLVAACGMALAGRAAADWVAPPRMARPDPASDEGGLWAIMDREETRLRRSPFAIRDESFTAYVRNIVCRLAGDHCQDIRVHLVRQRHFNASMAPNGAMQVWSGLMLRVDNEAQLAAVLGHEIGHYLERHSVNRLRDARDRAAFAQFLGVFGVVGLAGALGVAAGGFAYSRDMERSADRIGLTLMSRAGYEPREAARIWGNLLAESKARVESGGATRSVMFATHPAEDERRETLAALAADLPAGEVGEQEWLARTAPYRLEWLTEEIRRGDVEESLVLLARLIARSPAIADYRWARGDVLRLRGAPADADAAIADYRAAIALGNEPPETHRGLGMLLRDRKQVDEARACLRRYLELAPQAADAGMIKSYLEELRT